MAYQKRIVATGTAFNLENNGVWTFADVDGNGTQDLVYIKTRNTGTNKIEVHVADAASRYQRFVLQTGTVFDIEDNGVWTMSAKGDLVYIKTRNTGTGKIEYHVASKESRYQSFTKQVGTDFAVEDNDTWCLAPRIGSGQFADLYYIKIRNTGTNMVEAHAVSAQSEFKARLIDTGTGFNLEDNGTWLMTNHLGDPQRAPDLTYIKTRATGTNKIEVHINEA